MRFKKVLLIYPSYVQYRYYDPFIPISLGYISQSLSDANIENEVLDMSLGYKNSFVKSKIKNFEPDLIGFSMMTLSYKKKYEFLTQVKEIIPAAKIIVGGPHISTLGEKALEECQAIDYGAVLAGEETIVELCNGKPLEDIKGLIYRKHEKILFNGFRPIPQKLDCYSFPRYDKFELKKYWFAEDVPVPLVSSRGCPFQCTFCISRQFGGHRFYVRSPVNVVDEIEYWQKNGRSVFSFMDDNFTLDKKRVYMICDEIKRRGFDNLEYRCPNGVRADRTDKELLKRMRKVGFKLLGFGVESASERILKILKKGETIFQIEDAIKNACELGYRVSLFFLIGSPSETWDDLNASFSLALRYPVYEANFYNLLPIPNTELFEWVKKNNLFIYPPEQYLNFSRAVDERPVFITYELSEKDRKKALRRGKAVSEKVKRKYYFVLLSKCGIFGKIIGYFAVKDFIANKLMYFTPAKKLLRKIKKILIK